MSQGFLLETIRKLKQSSEIRKQLQSNLKRRDEVEKVDQLSKDKRLARETLQNVELFEQWYVRDPVTGQISRKFKCFNSIPHRADSSAPFSPIPLLD